MADEHYLKQAIESHHLKKAEISEALHISPGRLSRFLNGTTRMSREHEAQLSEMLLNRVGGDWMDIMVKSLKRFGRSIIQLLLKEKPVFKV
jgi:predicted XRE-type DNA-binding protein